MSAHVSSMCRSAYCFLRQLRPVVRSLTEDAAKTVVHAFISMRLDYCNSLLCGISDTLLRRLQSVENAAARVITRTPRRDHITPILHHLGYTGYHATTSGVQACCSGLQGTEQSSTRIPVAGLPACRRHRSARAPVVTQLYTPVRALPQAHGLAIVRSLPRLWNSLPADVRRTDVTVETFCRKLKTYLFGRDDST